MCFFPLPNTNYASLAYRKGVREFYCGSCPECLRRRSSIWALRAVYEAKLHSCNCMVTLTYDNFKRDSEGNICYDSKHNPIELPVDRDLVVNKRDVQLFIKRLRKYLFKKSGKRSSFPRELALSDKTFSCSDDSSSLKYIVCAEYGSRTHRAHYHLILFGFDFPDRHFYKKSKRGNSIYMSPTLTSLWGHGICTVDSVSVHSSIARYCTKYCAKSRSDSTFMLCSQKIGFESLYRDFNGLSYIIDGHEYPVPRFIWNHYISEKYKDIGYSFDYRYVNRDPSIEFSEYDYEFQRGKILRDSFRWLRDHDSLYSQYLSYWNFKGSLFDSNKLPVLSRIHLLDSRKYHNYKVAALEVLGRRKYIPSTPAPGSNCISAYFRDIVKFGSLALLPSCPNRASDTKKVCYVVESHKWPSRYRFLFKCFDDPPVFPLDFFQLFLDI